MTIVFSNTGDVDTRVLAALWEGIPDARVLNIRPGTPDARHAVDSAIAAEEDTLILCGVSSMPASLPDPIPHRKPTDIVGRIRFRRLS